jgi:hypothetical protein
VSESEVKNKKGEENLSFHSLVYIPSSPLLKAEPVVTWLSQCLLTDQPSEDPEQEKPKHHVCILNCYYLKWNDHNVEGLSLLLTGHNNELSRV